MASVEALENGVNLDTCFSVLEKSRKAGLTVPVIFMGYYNPFLQYGEQRSVKRLKEVGGNGFIIVDLPLGEESDDFVAHCIEEDISIVPLIAPTTSDDRMQIIAKKATGFIYCVSLSGVTGSRNELPSDLKDYVARIKRVSFY